jgi:anthranilate synthase/aminodeoxychorismate synthase-like glutamine amidotransferase
MRLLLLDNFDSFTYNLLDYFRQLGCEVLVRRNDVAVELLEELAFDGIVLSPGPGSSREAGNLLAVIEAWHQRVPMLGVCLGHQALGEFFGAQLTRGVRPMHGKVSEIEWTHPDSLWEGLPARMPVTRYHSLILQHLPTTFHVLARTADVHQEIMAFRHQQLPLTGMQFHPEALLTPHGLALLGNWVKSCIIAQTGSVPASGNGHP